MTKEKNIWQRFINFIKANISLVNIIAAALLVELVSGVTCFPQWGVPNRWLEFQADGIQ